MSNGSGTLYLVATPIGNLEDMSPRAVRILGEVDLIAAEDTRHSAGLMRHFAIPTRTTSLHEHNEKQKALELLALLQQGRSIALISDAGTPLISDPGYRLVRMARQAGTQVMPIPGPCAAIAALSAAGLPTDTFIFAGYPPAKAVARKRFFAKYGANPATLIFYESTHRILASLEDMVSEFGADREAVIARELTKRFETIRSGTLNDLYKWIQQNKEQQKGEFVVLIHGAETAEDDDIISESKRMLQILIKDLPPNRAAAVVAEITGLRKNILYDYVLKLK